MAAHLFGDHWWLYRLAALSAAAILAVVAHRALRQLFGLSTGLAPASRYTYYYRLLTPGYTTPELIRGFIRELEASRPRWVVTYVADTTLSPARARAPAHGTFLAWLQDHGRPEVRFGNLVAWQLSWRVAPPPGRGGGADRSPSSGAPRRPGPARPAPPR